MKLNDWADIQLEELNPAISRKAIHSERMTISRLFLKPGAIVPEHHHENEQVSMILKGRLKFIFPYDEVIVRAGQALEIPSFVPHRVEALEESEALDLFAPVREDWRNGEDAYLRSQPAR